MKTRPDLHRLLGMSEPKGHPQDHEPAQTEVARVGDVVIRRLELAGSAGTIPCLLMVPGDRPWTAGAVAVHQHGGEFALGKSEVAGLAGDPRVAYGIELAARGVVVIAPDLEGFEERRREGDDAKAEHYAAWWRAAIGETLQGRHSEDVATCVRWLSEQLPAQAGIGIVGHSLGGQAAFFSMAADERIRAGVLSCGVGTVQSFIEHGVVHNPAYFVPGIVEAGDTVAVAGLMTGQRIRMLSGSRDPLLPLDGVEAVAAGLPQEWSDVRVFEGGHEFPDGIRAEALDWLAERLLDAQ